MKLGVFPLVCLTGLLPFLSAVVWDRLPVPDSGITARLASRLPTATFGFVAILLVNAMSLGYVDTPDGVPDAVAEKSWNMFSNPPRDDGWFAIPVTLESGERVDALRGTAARSRPTSVGAGTGRARTARSAFASSGSNDRSTPRGPVTG